jgi:4-amino-4-deoxy-L-arabinose transferase-like glycosyltransferase
MVTPQSIRRAPLIATAIVALVYLHNTLPYLTTMPRVNVDEPWLMERAYQILLSGVPRQPMYGLHRAYLLQVGYPYLLAGWMAALGVGVWQARLLAVLLGLGTLLLVAALGKRLVGAWAGVAAALFLAADSNFLGSARNARTDMPAVFFAACAFVAYAFGREDGRRRWFVLSGAAAGLAMLCHGNAFWVAVILALWLIADLRGAVVTFARSWLVGGAAFAALAPYLVVIARNWQEVQRQITAFVPERVPFYTPARIVEQMALEVERYRTWYFGLVTNTVPNPLLWVFQAATVAGAIAVAYRLWSGRRVGGEQLLLGLVAGSVLIFAGFVNNKVPAYMPHLLIGFSLLAGVAVADIGQLIAPRWPLAMAFVVLYGGAATAYYEKWYATQRKSELLPYEQIARTVRAMVLPGVRHIYGSPHFWAAVHGDETGSLTSYALGPDGLPSSEPAYLLVDEAQWLPDMMAAGHESFARAWVDVIERRCALDSVALGTTYGTIAGYRCGEHRAAAPVRILGGATTYRIGEVVNHWSAKQLAAWPRYADPRRRPGDRPDVSLSGGDLRISGTGWPGIDIDYPATVGDAYLVRASVRNARDGDLLYLGTWKQPQVLSLSGGSSAGMPTPLAHEPWFPADRAFIATAPRVQIAIYSEAPRTDFTVAGVDIYRLRIQ